MLKEFFLVLGLLTLGVPAAAQTPDAPKGTYVKSCFGCTFIGEGRSMTCSCTKTNGGRSFTHADLLLCSSKSFSNQDGRLVCDATPPAKGKRN